MTGRTAKKFSEIKYGYKAYAYSHLEAGHMAQNLQLTATAQGVGSCTISGFVNDSISSILDLSKDEIPIYVLPFGWEERK